MNKQQFQKALALLREQPKRKFSQSFELIINLKGLNMKKPDDHVELFLNLPHNRGKEIKIGALVGAELIEQAKGVVDTAVVNDDFGNYDGKKKEIKTLARAHDYFIAQANIMPQVAKTFGRVLGPLGKMPNPKAGCVVPPNANLQAVADKLKNLVRVSAKTQPSIKVAVGTEAMKDEDIVENLTTIYTSVLHALPQERNNISSVLVKLTMSKPVIVTDKEITLKGVVAQ